MNESTQKYLNRILEMTRKVYGKTNFTEAYETISNIYSYYLNIKEMVSNEKFNVILENEINKGFKYAKQLSYKKN